ncbi:MAG TPA: hypothetical protein VLB69_00740, partial [Rudaea sp.]|nr:hypothetical protein [Rudaea sp.]
MKRRIPMPDSIGIQQYVGGHRMKMVSVPVSIASAIWSAIALCLASSALAATGNVSGIVQSATTSEPLT